VGWQGKEEAMNTTLAGSGSVLRALIVVIVLLAIAIGLAGALGSSVAFLGIAWWGLTLVVAAAGALLLVRGRPIAGVGAILVAISVLVAFQVAIESVLWTVLFLGGVLLIALGTRADTVATGAWPLLLIRAGIGWALVDNAQDHFRTRWLPSVQGTGFFQTATGAANRPAAWVGDDLYGAFLRDVVVPNVDVWAGLTVCGELLFGTLLAIGLFTPVAALGAMWLHLNYMNMKSFLSHGAYTDKVFFVGEAFSLVTAAGLVYGLDASLRRLAPPLVAQWLMGASGAELPLPSPVQPEPRPA
jgi:uncharacterized membrane protein YphA (DoxX/SURF4 family)